MKKHLRKKAKKRKEYKGHKNIQIFTPTRTGKGKKITYRKSCKTMSYLKNNT